MARETAGSGSDVVKTVDKAFGLRLLVETVNDAFLAVDNAEHIEAAAGWADFITDASAHFLSARSDTATGGNVLAALNENGASGA